MWKQVRAGRLVCRLFRRARNFGEASVQYSYFYDSKPNRDQAKAVSGGFRAVNGFKTDPAGEPPEPYEPL
jgi:hypothetical protein